MGWRQGGDGGQGRSLQSDGRRGQIRTCSTQPSSKAWTRDSCSEFLHSSSVLFFPSQAGKNRKSVIPHHMGLSWGPVIWNPSRKRELREWLGAASDGSALWRSATTEALRILMDFTMARGQMRMHLHWQTLGISPYSIVHLNFSVFRLVGGFVLVS